MAGVVERESRNFAEEAHNRGSFQKRVLEGIATSALGRAGARLLLPLSIEKGIDSLGFNLPDFANVQALGKFLSEGSKLIVVSNHQSQGDLAVLAYVADVIRFAHSETIKGFDLFVAKTMGGGQQGKILQTMYREGIYPWAVKQGINPIEIVSDNDVASRGMVKDRESMAAVFSALKNREKAILVFPEGTMNGGRRNAQGELNGVSKMNASSKELVEHMVKKKGVVFLPIGTHGLYEIFSPDSRNFTIGGITQLTLNSMPTVFGINSQRMIGEFRIGEPFTGDDLREFEDPALEVMRRISELVPEEARGIFRQDRLEFHPKVKA